MGESADREGMDVRQPHPDARLYCGDCLAILPTLPDASVDAVITDPPYACVDRPYGYWTEEEWFALMKPVVRECRRVLKPKGSAVFILQPNSERVGKMRLWLYDFLSWAGREWNLVQDVHWWNFVCLPSVAASQYGLLRGSLKTCVWLGPEDCHRDQDAILWTESDHTTAERLAARAGRFSAPVARSPSGCVRDKRKTGVASARRGGVTPFNVLPMPNSDPHNSAGAEGHGAGTPEPLCDWWLRYLTRPGDVVLDPFMGIGTVGRAALRLMRRFIGVDRVAEYVDIADRLLAGPITPLFDESAPPAARQQGALF